MYTFVYMITYPPPEPLKSHKMNNNIKKYFSLYFYNKKFKVVYTELEDGTFIKTYTKNLEPHIEIISPSEYTAALTYNNYLLMKNIPSQLP